MSRVQEVERRIAFDFSSNGDDVWQRSFDLLSLDDEVRQVVPLLRRSWERISVESLNKIEPALSLFDASLLLRVLPAYLILSLHDETRLWLIIVNEIVPPWKQGEEPTFRICLNEMTKPQVAVLGDWCEVIKEKKRPKPNIARRLQRIADALKGAAH